jgi:hypothetical protein
MTHSQNSTKTAIAFAITLTLAIASFASFVSAASAASYAYVDATGEVKSVTANDWMSAIATAPNIHINSGVFILKTAADFEVVGNDVPGA